MFQKPISFNFKNHLQCGCEHNELEEKTKKIIKHITQQIKYEEFKFNQCKSLLKIIQTVSKIFKKIVCVYHQLNFLVLNISLFRA